MPNAVLTRLVEERAEQVSFIDGLLCRVETESRDLVDAERSNLQAARQRIQEIDEQRTPLEEFESLREISAESTRLAYGGGSRSTGNGAGSTPEGGTSRGLGTSGVPRAYRTAGEFVVDVIKARGYPAESIEPDQSAAQRVAAALGVEARAVEKMTTAETPGLLPEVIVGEILNDLDEARPFVNSIGAKPLAGIPGRTFGRPFISQHTLVGEQLAEKTELPSRALKVDSLEFRKRTFGGVVNISRQDIDWTSPSAWDALLADLQAEYGADTDDVAAAALADSITQEVPVVGTNLEAWVRALYAAASMAVTGGGTMRASARRLPNVIWTSVDMWATLGATITAARLKQAVAGGNTSNGPTSFSGDILDIPRIMVPGMPEGTVIIGRKEKTEFYEQRIGILSAVEPRIFGVEVAYGGYAAFGTLDPTAFAKLTADGGGGGTSVTASGTGQDAAVTASGTAPTGP